MPRNELHDFDSPSPTPIQDLHLRICYETPEEQAARNARHNAPPIVRPPRIKTTIAEQKSLASDPAAPPDIRQRAIDVLTLYSGGYEQAAKEVENASPEYKHFSGILAIMGSGRADFACLDFQD